MPSFFSLLVFPSVSPRFPSHHPSASASASAPPCRAEREYLAHIHGYCTLDKFIPGALIGGDSVHGCHHHYCARLCPSAQSSLSSPLVPSRRPHRRPEGLPADVAPRCAALCFNRDITHFARVESTGLRKRSLHSLVRPGSSIPAIHTSSSLTSTSTSSTHTHTHTRTRPTTGPLPAAHLRDMAARSPPTRRRQPARALAPLPPPREITIQRA
ncbi:hypothetical protein BS50DRAFT_36789 [Corynespora cassiicola Philippines]|uniref:Uncharacterized protein n=1 Tax=Corynespora cassiicola Philippines TaxID=1448308 RepID=A0A2T2PC76_CORCC|nr:hypothetical protein BS50DRAFT_36789 [Corynespora cassiicola Philippines]